MASAESFESGADRVKMDGFCRCNWSLLPNKPGNFQVNIPSYLKIIVNHNKDPGSLLTNKDSMECHNSFLGGGFFRIF